MAGAKTSTEILQDMLEIPGIKGIVIVGRDGFIIETIGSFGDIDMDMVGASLAMVMIGTDKMRSELQLSEFHTLTLEASDAMIMCNPLGDALLVILASDSKTLGMIRIQAKKHTGSLVEMF